MSFASVVRILILRLHEAVSTESSDRFADGTVIRELQKGYVWEGKVLRAAKVVVARIVPDRPQSIMSLRHLRFPSNSRVQDFEGSPAVGIELLQTDWRNWARVFSFDFTSTLDFGTAQFQ
jgi:hypothetical protein